MHLAFRSDKALCHRASRTRVGLAARNGWQNSSDHGGKPRPCMTSGGFATHPHEFDLALGRRGLRPEARTSGSLLDRRAPTRCYSTGRGSGWPAAMRYLREIGAQEEQRRSWLRKRSWPNVATLKVEIPELESRGKEVSKEVGSMRSRQIPNLPLREVPDGNDASSNVEHHHFGAKRSLRFCAQTAFRARRSARTDGFRDCRQAFGLHVS